MAVITNQADSKFKIVVSAGVDDNNKAILKSKTFSNVKASAENEDLYNLGVAISDLQEYELTNILRIDEFELIEEV
ncbi:MAG: DUF1659 domain-containing protein [Tissierellia bacterium]|nr:DUF1659 domain-containing protein [Tissierellia bacterium]